MLEVKEQERLSFRRLLDICLDSISYRLLRSVVTVVIILLAIAFLAFIMLQGYLGRSTRDAVLARTARMTAYSRFLSEASRIMPDEKLVRSFAELSEGPGDLDDLAAWGQFSRVEAVEFVRRSRTAVTYLDFFQDIPLGRRALLVEQHEGLVVFEWLGASENLDAFLGKLQNMKSLRTPQGTAALRAFVGDWLSYRAKLKVIKANYAATIRRISELCGPEGLSEALNAAVANGRVEELFGRIAEAGLRVDRETIGNLVDGITHQEQLSWAFSQLRKPPVRTGWNREFQENFSPGSALRSCASSPARIRWIQRRLQEAGLDQDFDAARFQHVAEEHRQWQDLLQKEQSLMSRYGQARKLSSKTVWLMFVSFLVCVVGIANAMLMSVLERFKEIATMKCLGARNEMIAFLFITESTIIGIVGGLGGTIVGFVIAVVLLAAQYGPLVFEGFPVGDVLFAVAICFCCSLLLATVAAIYPAWVASRMAPMEAMRVE